MNRKLRFAFLLAFIIVISSLTASSRVLSQSEILNLVNQDRKMHGLSALTLNPTLNLAALAKAQDMTTKKYFAHTSPEGSTPWQWFRNAGYNYIYAGENLAEGYTDEEELVNSWMSSPAHRANILSPYYSDLGLAVVSFNNTNLIVQLFGSEEARITLK